MLTLNRKLVCCCMVAMAVVGYLAGEVPGQENKPSTAASQAKRQTLRRHAAAGLAALNIYNTFGCLGLTADLYEAKECDSAKVKQITGDVVKTSDLAIEMLKNARREEGEAGSDVPYEDLIQCYYLLDREARLLEEASDSGQKEQLQEFHQAREETWKKVKVVLGIEESKEGNQEKPK